MPLPITVDRIEGGRALLDIDGEIVDVPAAALPDGSGEGAVLALSEQDATPERDRASARLERLKARDTLPDDIEL